VRAKVERAKENLRDMERLFAQDGYIPGIKMHVTSRKPPTRAIPYLFMFVFRLLPSAGDVVVNLRGALDHLAYQLAKVHRPRITIRQREGHFLPDL